MNTKENKKKKFEYYLYTGLLLLIAGNIIEWRFGFPYVTIIGIIVSIYSFYLRYVYDL